MKKAIFATACLLLAAQTWHPSTEPSETTKRRALLLGYWVNGDSMVRSPALGSIDVSELLKIFPEGTVTAPPLNNPDKRQD